MPKLTIVAFDGTRFDLDVDQGSTVMENAVRNSVPGIEAECGGACACATCHDFNNVLTAILLSSDHLLLQARPSDASFADLIEIKRNANRAAVLVRQLLAFSRKQTMRPSVLNLTDVVGDLRMTSSSCCHYLVARNQ